MTDTLVLNRDQVYEEVGYDPHSKQALFHASKARFKIPTCGRRFGKSNMAAAEALPELINPTIKTRGWIVGPEYSDSENEFEFLWQWILFDLGFEKKFGRQLKRSYNTRTGEMFIEMPWGSRVDAKSAKYPKSLVGKGLHWMIVSEAAKLNRLIWKKYLRPTLSDYNGWASFPSTPEGFNWYYELWRDGQKPKKEQHRIKCWGRPGKVPMYESWNFPAWENPYVYPGGFNDPEVQSQIAGDDDPWFWQEIGAEFTSIVGRIYKEFDEKLHVYENFFEKDHYDYRPDWPDYCALDFGYSNPFVCLDIQVAPSGDVFIWREHYKPGYTVGDHIGLMKARQDPDGYSRKLGFGDSADPGAVEELSRNFVAVQAQDEAKDWVQGVREVKRLLKDKNKRPHLFVSSACPFTIEEFKTYKMKAAPRDDQDADEKAHKANDHALDALRYFVMHLFFLGAGRYSLSDVEVKDGYSNERGGIFTRSSDSVFTMSPGGRSARL